MPDLGLEGSFVVEGRHDGRVQKVGDGGTAFGSEGTACAKAVWQEQTAEVEKKLEDPAGP